ncbi:unnamed protein product, partial [Thlaspi arvense]
MNIKLEERKTFIWALWALVIRLSKPYSVSLKDPTTQTDRRYENSRCKKIAVINGKKIAVINGYIDGFVLCFIFRARTDSRKDCNRHEIVNNQSPGDVPGNVLLVTFEGVESHGVSIDVIHLTYYSNYNIPTLMKYARITDVDASLLKSFGREFGNSIVMLADDRIHSDSRWFLEMVLHEIIHAPSCSLSFSTPSMALSLLSMACATFSIKRFSTPSYQSWSRLLSYLVVFSKPLWLGLQGRLHVLLSLGKRPRIHLLTWSFLEVFIIRFLPSTFQGQILEVEDDDFIYKCDEEDVVDQILDAREGEEDQDIDIFDVVNMEKSFEFMPIFQENKNSLLTGKTAEKRLKQSIEKDLELVYVAQSCLSWEALQHQYITLKESLKSDDSKGGFYNDNISKELQKFQVLLERFLEDERCEGKRVLSFVQRRFDLIRFFQVPRLS